MSPSANRKPFGSACIAFAVLAMVAYHASGQSRKEVSITTPGHLSTPGSSSVSNLRGYGTPAGLGGLLTSPGGGGSVLNSTIGNTNFNVPSPGLSADRGGGDVLRSTLGDPGRTGFSLPPSGSSSKRVYDAPQDTNPRKDMRYEGPTPATPGLNLPLPGTALTLAPDAGSAIAARAYLAEVGTDTGGELGKTESVITSLVPAGDSLYRRYMLDGENRFRNGEYAQAFDQFKLANGLAGNDAESLLSMLHARFALSSVSYTRAAYYLQLALKYQPELPLVPLRPRAFYGDPTQYVEQMYRLEQYLGKSPADVDAQLVYAYFCWFDPTVPRARAQEALARALGSRMAELGGAENVRDATLDAIDIFWRGIVASAKLTGQLKPIAPPTPPKDTATEP